MIKYSSMTAHERAKEAMTLASRFTFVDNILTKTFPEDLNVSIYIGSLLDSIYLSINNIDIDIEIEFTEIELEKIIAWIETFTEKIEKKVNQNTSTLFLRANKNITDKYGEFLLQIEVENIINDNCEIVKKTKEIEYFEAVCK